MAAEEVLKLFDFYWFEQRLRVFTTEPPSSTPITNNPPPKLHQEPNLPHTPTLQIRSLSDRLSGSEISFSPDFPSPYSGILKSKLRKIISGKEVRDVSDPEAKEKEETEIPPEKKPIAGKNKWGNSKSLSELEFEELKGLMDLGFVFSEEDKNSSLVSIVPGLQRLGRNSDDEEVNGEHMISRPYLSEAWGFLPLIDWRIQALRNKIDMKDRLRAWAQSVASTIKP